MKRSFPKSLSGFTLFELLVAIVIIVILSIGAIIAINPIGMINRAQDSRRLADMNRIKIALEEYFNDNNCYPSSVPFGQTWTVNNNPLLQVPQDPKYPAQSYYYTSGPGCSRWYVMFYHQLSQENPSPNCNLPTSCLPVDYQPSWSCLISGNVDCSVVTDFVLP
jgi:prepilin-type N-terminal cleavage/methylation domain-containing protein